MSATMGEENSKESNDENHSAEQVPDDLEGGENAKNLNTDLDNHTQEGGEGGETEDHLKSAKKKERRKKSKKNRRKSNKSHISDVKNLPEKGELDLIAQSKQYEENMDDREEKPDITCTESTNSGDTTHETSATASGDESECGRNTEKEELEPIANEDISKSARTATNDNESDISDNDYSDEESSDDESLGDVGIDCDVMPVHTDEAISDDSPTKEQTEEKVLVNEDETQNGGQFDAERHVESNSETLSEGAAANESNNTESADVNETQNGAQVETEGHVGSNHEIECVQSSTNESDTIESTEEIETQNGGPVDTESHVCSNSETECVKSFANESNDTESVEEAETQNGGQLETDRHVGPHSESPRAELGRNESDDTETSLNMEESGADDTTDSFCGSADSDFAEYANFTSAEAHASEEQNTDAGEMTSEFDESETQSRSEQSDEDAESTDYAEQAYIDFTKIRKKHTHAQTASNERDLLATNDNDVVPGSNESQIVSAASSAVCSQNAGYIEPAVSPIPELEQSSDVSTEGDYDDSNEDTLVDDKFCTDMNNNVAELPPLSKPTHLPPKSTPYNRRVSDPTLRYFSAKKFIGRRDRRVRSFPMTTANKRSLDQSETESQPRQPIGNDHVSASEQRGLTSLYNLVVSMRTNGNKKNKLRVADLQQLLQSKGILATDPRLRETNDIIEKEVKGAETELQKDVFLRIARPSFALVRKALLNHLTIPGFEFFKRRMSRIFDAVSSTLQKLEKNSKDRKARSTATSNSYLSVMLKRRLDKSSTVNMSVCTVDGQQLTFGNRETLHPLNSCADILNYCEACRQNGIETMENYIGNKPMPEDKDEFSTDALGRVWNPFTKAGKVMTSALLLRGAESTEARLSSLHEAYSKAMAGEPIWCDNLSYNLKRLYEHEDISLAYYLSAKDKLPRFHALTPGDALELQFQSTSTATSCDRCAISAATLAANGLCPFTGETVFKEEIVDNTLQAMKNCNTIEVSDCFDEAQNISFTWSEKGCVLLVVPGVMGVVCFTECQPQDVMKELTKCLVQNLLSTFNFSVYRSLKRRTSVQVQKRR